MCVACTEHKYTKASFNICPTYDKVKKNPCHVFIPDFDLATCTVRASPTVGKESPSEHKKTSKCGLILQRKGLFPRIT